jgi:hypothetical protein
MKFEIPDGTTRMIIPTAMSGTLIFLDAEGRSTMQFQKTGIESLEIPIRDEELAAYGAKMTEKYHIALINVANARDAFDNLQKKSAIELQSMMEERDRLVVALRDMKRTHSMHGPCFDNDCARCQKAYKLAESVLRSIG